MASNFSKLEFCDMYSGTISFNFVTMEFTSEYSHKSQSAIIDALKLAKSKTGNRKPIVILLHTEMGNGVDFMMNTHKWHGSAPNDLQLSDALSQNAETLGDY